MLACDSKEGTGKSCVGDGVGVSQVHVNPIQLLNAPTTSVDPPKQYGLLYVNNVINGVLVKAILDSGISHIFFAEKMVPKLRLDLAESSLQMKAVNS